MARKQQRWQPEPEPPYELVCWVAEACKFPDALDRPWYVVPIPPSNQRKQKQAESWEFPCNCSNLPVRVCRHAYGTAGEFIFVGQCNKCHAILWASSVHHR